MKKVDLKFLLAQIGILAAVSLVIGWIISIANGEATNPEMIIPMFLMFFFILGCIYMGLSSLFTRKLVKKTINAKAAENGFANCSTFHGSGAVLKINEQAGKIAYVANQNPFEFQVISAKDIYDIKSSYKKGPLGGTGYVYFEFYYNKKRVRIPTFTSNQMYSLKSAQVLEGISKADTYCEILQIAKNNAM